MPRQKLTEGSDGKAADLPELSPQRQEFTRLLLDGKTASDAYRGSFDCSSMSNKSVWVEASRLRNNPDIALWLSAARQACLGTATVTYEGHVRELERIREIALSSGNIGAAVQAEQIRGKAAGLHVEQVRDVTERFDPVSTVRELAAMTGVDPHIIAAQHGITLPDESTTKH